MLENLFVLQWPSHSVGVLLLAKSQQLCYWQYNMLIDTEQGPEPVHAALFHTELQKNFQLQNPRKTRKYGEPHSWLLTTLCQQGLLPEVETR